jgi:spore coat polysaccharide biosynthesis predicted glycosyltransferase SpsG
MDRKVIFRCDAGHSPEIGTGHIARSKTLANSLVKSGLLSKEDIFFYTRNDPDFTLGQEYLEGSSFKYQTFSENSLQANSTSELEILANSNASIIFMDRLETSSGLIKGLLKSGKRVVSFDDYGPGRVHANLAISAIFDNVEISNNLIKGYEYLILSKEKYHQKPIRSQIKKIVATFGGIDARDLCSFFLQNSSVIPNLCSVDIVLGRCDESVFQDYLQYLESNNLEDRFRIFISPSNYHEIIAEADLAITSGGLSIFEFSAYGIPSIALPQYEHQLRTIKNLGNESICLPGTDNMDLCNKKFRDCMSKMINNVSYRQNMALKARERIDGGGIHRITTLLKDKFPDIFYD